MEAMTIKAEPRKSSGSRFSQTLCATEGSAVSTRIEFMSRTDSSAVDLGTVVPTVAPGRPYKPERSKRRIGLVCGVGLLLSAACFAWQAFGAPNEGNAAPSKIQARSFAVVDSSGKELAEFGVLQNGQPGMIIWGKDRGIAASIGIDQSGMPRFAFENSKGEALLELGVGDKLAPVFFMRSPDGKRRLGAIVTETGSVAIGLYDSLKRDRCMVRVGPDGHPEIILRDEQGKARVSLTVDDKGTAAFVLLDRTGNERTVFQVDTQGNADAAVIGSDGKPTWSAAKK